VLSEEEKRRRMELQRKLAAEHDMPPDWPILIDPITQEHYYPGDRYLEQLWKRRGEALMAAVRSVIAAERSGAWK
jgi:hypothetical protein